MTTLAALLYRNVKDAGADLEAKLRDHNLLKAVAAIPGAVGDVAEVVLTFLDTPIGNLAIQAHQKHRLIEQAKRQTARAPGSRQVVKLHKHTVKHKQKPKVEMEINGLTTTVLELELEAVLSIETLEATVDSGHVVDLTPGEATAEVTLSAGGIELARAETRPVDLSLPEEATIVIDLTAMGEPIELPGPTAQVR